MEWLLYLLKVSACAALFFAFYVMALRKLTFFRANRFYLLFSLLLSFVVPALNVEIEKALPPIILQVSTQEVRPSVPLQPIATTPITTASNINWTLWLSMLYTAVVVALLALTLWRLLQLLKHTHVYNRVGGLKLICKNDGFTNCSFFNYVFIGGEQLTAAEFDLLLKHEEVHAKQYHSIDKLLLLVAKAVLWFNPIIYLYNKELEQIHEYEADASASSNFGTRPYANLLLRLAIQEYSGPLVHNFVKSPIKERIKMLYQSKSKNMKKLSYVLALPIASGLVWGFAVNVVYAQEKVIETKNVPAKEVRVNSVDEVKAEKVASKNNVTLKARNKAGVARTGVVAVNDVVIVGGATGRGGEQVSAVRDVVVRGTVDRVIDSRNDVVVVAKADNVNDVRRTNVKRVVDDVVVENLQAETRTVGVGRINDVVVAGRTDNVIGSQVRTTVSRNGTVSGNLSSRTAGIGVGRTYNGNVADFDENGPFYKRYTQAGNDGKEHDVALLRTAAGSWASADIPKGGKVMIYVDGMPYSESQAGNLTKAMVQKYNTVAACEKDSDEFAKKYPHLVGKYDAVLELKNTK